MPTYEYKCPAGHVFEKFFPTMHDKRREKCPVCGRQAERQISGGTGLVFKGSGFYITDYKRAGEKQQEGKVEPTPTPESKPTPEPSSPACSRRCWRPATATVEATPGRASLSTSSSSPPIPPVRCTWATAARRRWATRSRRCSTGRGGA